MTGCDRSVVRSVVRKISRLVRFLFKKIPVKSALINAATRELTQHKFWCRIKYGNISRFIKESTAVN